MKNFSRFMFWTIVVVVAGAAIFLATWDIPAPVSSVEIVIPNDRFQK